ncbi:MAG: alpha-ketoglutarate-dependent dioxygenase AlkB [Myxacorys californica WJT36-NPBG1]|jgi:alkylated DNA repair dioxygenase AlkB|nr:alpha-ketoglutarate-dependent dioxygenase AlkB [Myxacorys californica WJT36-NPBG1]
MTLEGTQLELIDERTLMAPVDFYPNFLSPQEADWLFEASQQLDWQQNQIRMLGKWLDVPRLEAIYGDEGCDYLYSKTVLLQPSPWADPLQWLREKIEDHTGYRYHIVIGNRYRNGKDSIGWHADKEPTMGEKPAIASISLGATCRFSIKPKGSRGETQHFELEHGSLIFMRPGCQSTHVHQVSKTAKPLGERINWTFRPHVKGARR